LELPDLVYLLGGLFVCCSLIKLLPIDHWTIRFFDYPQLQFLTLGVVTIIISIIWLDFSFWQNWIFIVTIFSIAIYQGSLIVPYTVFVPKELKSASKANADVTVLVSNVYQPNESYNSVLDLIKKENPDIVFLVETNDKWAKECAMLDEMYEYSLKHPLDNMYGLLFYTNLKMISGEIQFRVKDDIPSVKCQLRLNNGQEILFYGVHPEPPSPTENYRSTERDAELYLLAKEIAGNEYLPTIVAGDLNDVAWSKSTRVFQRLSQLLDPRKGRGFFNTFHAKYPIKWPLDHFFVSDHFEIVDISVLENVGSDHYPINLSMKYAIVNGNNSVDEPDEDDKEEASEQIEKATNN